MTRLVLHPDQGLVDRETGVGESEQEREVRRAGWRCQVERATGAQRNQAQSSGDEVAGALDTEIVVGNLQRLSRLARVRTPIWGVAPDQIDPVLADQACDRGGVGGIRTEQAVPSESPQIARLDVEIGRLWQPLVQHQRSRVSAICAAARMAATASAS